MRKQSELNIVARRLGLSPVVLDGPDERLTPDQHETFGGDLRERPDEVALLGFNDAGWLVYYVGDLMTSVAPDGEAFTGRDVHLRRFKGAG